MSRLAEAYYAKHGHYPDEPGFKTDGPSREAAASVGSIRSRELHGLILAELRQRPQTADEVAETLGHTPFLIRPRFSELLALGRIADARERRRNKNSKRSATVWRAT